MKQLAKNRISAILMVLPLVSTYAATETIDGFCWYYRDLGDGVEVTSPSEFGGQEDATWWDGRSLSVPEMLGEKPVVSIGNNAFASGSFSAISVPNTVTNIGDSAFANLPIQSFSFPPNLKSIGGCAFANCTSLDGIDLPGGLTYIGWGAFSATAITSVTIPTGVTEILFDTFADCYSLWAVNFHDGIRGFQSGAFRGCYLGWVTLPKNIEYLDQDAFLDSGCIEEFEVSPKLNYLDFSAFRHTQVGRITIPDSGVGIGRTEDGSGNDWTGIGFVTTPWNRVQDILDALTVRIDYDDGSSSTFWHGPQVLAISDSVAEIPDEMFKGRGCLEAFTWPDGLKRIGKSAFEDCWNMTQTRLPDTLEVVDDYAFRGCNCFGLGGNWTGEARVDDTVVIPQSVQFIGRQAFSPTVGGDSTSMVKFFFEGLPPTCHPEAFTNYVCSFSDGQWKATAGYYLPAYENEWRAVIDAKGEFCGLPMHRADLNATTAYETVNGVRWPYYVEDGRAVLGFYDGVGGLSWQVFIGSASMLKKIEGELVVPATIGGYSVVRINSGVFNWEGPVNSLTIPASVSVLGTGNTMGFQYRGKPSRIRFCGLPPANLERSNLIHVSDLYEYPLSKEASWLAFFEEHGLTLNAVPYDDSGEIDTGVYESELEVTSIPFAGIYDGNPHTITVQVAGAPEMLSVKYATSPRGPYVEQPPSFTSVCTNVPVYFCVSAKDCRSVYGYDSVTIYEKIGRVTLKTPVPVPVEWLKGVYKLSDNANFEYAAQRYTGKFDPVIGPLQAWHEYVMGTDPSDPRSRFVVGLESKEGGGFRVTWSPDKRNEHHLYEVVGKRTLFDIEWTVIPDPENPPPGYCFFAARVSLDDYMTALLNAQRPTAYFAGDINGDGMISDDDLTMLKHYLTYLNIIKNGLAGKHVSSEWKLEGSSLDAADVNGDGTVDKDDEKELKGIIKGRT